ncbi:MAG: cytochrome C biogenesis protein [Pseudomonadota bacterium]
MTFFVVSCLGLVLVSGLFYLFPRIGQRTVEEDLSRSNRALFKRRAAELATEENAALEQDARLRLLEDEQQAQAPSKAAERGAMPLWWLLPFVALFSTVTYYQLGSAPDVVITQQLQSVDDSMEPATMQALMADIEDRAGQRPDNLYYSALLGRYYMGLEEYSRASAIYGELAEQAPEDAQALAYAAQAEFLAAGRVLDERSQMLAEQALAVNPHQRTALGLLGMASFERGQYRAAIGYWQRLLAVEPPDSESASMIQGVITLAEARLNGSDAVAEAPAATTEPGGPVGEESAVLGVSVRVQLPDGASLAPSDTVFVLARAPQSASRMPIAVQRLTGQALPATLRLDDRHSMAGQKISTTETVMVLVQVSPSGQPGEANASWLGQAGPVAPSIDGEVIDITLRPSAG